MPRSRRGSDTISWRSEGGGEAGAGGPCAPQRVQRALARAAMGPLRPLLGPPSEAAVGGSWAPNLLLFGSPKPPKSHLGCVLGVSCGGFGASWGLLSASRALLGASHGDGYGIRKAYKQYRRPKRLLARIWGHLGGRELVAHAGRGARIKSLTNHLSCQNT